MCVLSPSLCIRGLVLRDASDSGSSSFMNLVLIVRDLESFSASFGFLINTFLLLTSAQKDL